MANSTLKGKTFSVPPLVLKSIKASLSSYKEGGDTRGKRRAEGLLDGQVTYEEMKRLKNFFDTYDGSSRQEYKLSGGDLMKQWVSKQLETARDGIDDVKRTRMNAGEENQFIKTHEKDKDNANPTNVNLPTLHKGSMYDQIMNNKVRYESIEKEIDSVRYLIEYMDNKKSKVI